MPDGIGVLSGDCVTFGTLFFGVVFDFVIAASLFIFFYYCRRGEGFIVSPLRSDISFTPAGGVRGSLFLRFALIFLLLLPEG
jgi:hypothetical protein